MFCFVSGGHLGILRAWQTGESVGVLLLARYRFDEFVSGGVGFCCWDAGKGNFSAERLVGLVNVT